MPVHNGVSSAAGTLRLTAGAAARRAFRYCPPLIAAGMVVVCGASTSSIGLDSPDFVFRGTITSETYPSHQFTAPRAGNLAASVSWASPQVFQTVCVARTILVDAPATCATSVDGATNSVTLRVASGELYTTYAFVALADSSASAQYVIEVRIR
jgi:hypothetical protein